MATLILLREMRDEIQLFQGTVIVFERCLFLGMWVETTSSSFPNTEKQASPPPPQKKKKKKKPQKTFHVLFRILTAMFCTHRVGEKGNEVVASWGAGCLTIGQWP